MTDYISEPHPWEGQQSLPHYHDGELCVRWECGTAAVCCLCRLPACADCYHECDCADVARMAWLPLPYGEFGWVCEACVAYGAIVAGVRQAALQTGA